MLLVDVSVPEVLDRPGDDSGAPLELEPPPVVVVVGGFSVVEGLGVVLGDGVLVDGSDDGVFDGEGSGFGPGPGPGFGFGGTTGGGGVTTLVVSLPSAPTEVTVVGGGVELEGAPGVGEPLTVIGPPGTALPGTSWTPAGAMPCPPPGTPVPPAVAETPGLASSAIAAKAVATTRPLTPSTA
ncbi:hypothetical protein SAMN04489729_7360 [Amycolatopsis lurida]|uniref:Uncharacterized protein n=1 Tax=Amycolatopsis lurida NRRL 2430 TaxID=1460371 RepID=A0A2P2FIJ0_AMYLU|nr:hypothetical protein [Amycolatopsis lurida]KFU76540.1 hypothetical protein BB31_35310 [Amycolatopsis lurida NRRL 2430]SEE39511.1 hypothetical protein SAMN04489729_7360 [Amycolatopsis lurida]